MEFVKLINTDPALEKGGVWINYGRERVLVARSGGANKEFLKLLAEEQKPIKRALELGLVSDEVGAKIAARVYAKTIIKGWQTLVGDEWVDGFLTKDEGIVPPTVQNVLARLNADPEILWLISQESNRIALYCREALESEAGN